MEAEQCVCGHPKSEHLLDFHSDMRCRNCPCLDYQPTKPWPDSEGIWWCDKKKGPREVALSSAGNFLFQGYSRQKFEAWVGPARFVKLIETNPFAQ